MLGEHCCLATDSKDYFSPHLSPLFITKQIAIIHSIYIKQKCVSAKAFDKTQRVYISGIFISQTVAYNAITRHNCTSQLASSIFVHSGGLAPYFLVLCSVGL